MLGAWSCQICFVLFSILSCVGGFLDLDELSSINYGIDFASEPILLSQEPLPPGTVQLSTKHGQLYQCSFPNIQEEEKKEKEEEKVAMDTGIQELLKPMETAPCLVHTKDWWSYEFCYKKHIRQYHLEDGKIQGNVMYLGMYERDYDWSNVTEAMAKSNEHRLNRYHTQQYTNGTVCDLTEKLRRTEVRFQCEEGHSDYVNRVDEPETCVYILTVHTSKVCHHPFLKPPSAHKPVPISCSPVVTEEQYQMYIEDKQESEKKSLERRAHEANILKFLDTGKLEGEEDVSKTDKKPVVTDSTKASESKDAEDEDEEEEEDKEILDEFDKGIKDMDLSEEQKAHAVKHKENIAHAVTAKIEDIIQEAEEEVARDEGEPVQLNRGTTFKKLAKTLSTLLTKMEEKEKELKDMDENIDSSEKTDDVDATDLDKRKNKQPVEKSEKTDHRIKVRVTRGAKAQARARSTQSSLKIPQSQKSKLEDKVRDELQQAGMDVKGRNIQVKIVTAGYHGDDEETIHVLSEEESASFNQMILTLLGGDAEANKQAQKQTNMENNYNKVWSDKQQKKKTET